MPDELDKLIDEVIDWATAEDPNRVNEWLGFAKRYMKRWEWNDEAIKDFLEWGKYGFNNKLLHFETGLIAFYSEILYCSDRMSLDRLFRCHVAYRTLKKPQ